LKKSVTAPMPLNPIELKKVKRDTQKTIIAKSPAIKPKVVKPIIKADSI
jgi:hypothetical protein